MLWVFSIMCIILCSTILLDLVVFTKHCLVSYLVVYVTLCLVVLDRMCDIMFSIMFAWV